MTPPITADAGGTRGHKLAEPRGVDATNGQDWHTRGVSNLGKAFAADLRAVARFACGLESRTGQHIVNRARD